MKVRGQTAINSAASGLWREAFSAALRLHGNGLQQRGVAPASPCDAPAMYRSQRKTMRPHQPLPDPLSPPELTARAETCRNVSISPGSAAHSCDKLQKKSYLCVSACRVESESFIPGKRGLLQHQIMAGVTVSNWAVQGSLTSFVVTGSVSRKAVTFRAEVTTPSED